MITAKLETLYPEAARLNKGRHFKVSTSALTLAIMLSPNAAQAADAVNTATITIPAGMIDPNTSNNTVTDTDTVTLSAIVATADTVTGVNGATGNTSVVNLFTGDTINGSPATASNSTLSLAPAATLPSVLTFDPATGVVGVKANTPAGTYTFDYQICETLNPTNCKIATASVTVDASPIVATNDTVTGINGASGATSVVNAFTSDTINGVAASTSNAVLSVATGSTVPTGLTFNTATGAVDVAAGTAAGEYHFDYKICEALNPGYCKTATISVTVDEAPVVATADTVTGVNGVAGATAVLNVLTGDTVNGATATTANATLSLAPGATLPTGLTFNTATGAVDVAPGTPSGTHSFSYQICETLNPSNCKVALASVTITPAADLVLTKSNGGSTLNIGQTTTYTITVTNNGPDSATGALIKDTVVSGLDCAATNPVTFSGSGVPSGSFTVAELTGVGITLGTLGNGQSVSLSYSCKVTGN